MVILHNDLRTGEIQHCGGHRLELLWKSQSNNGKDFDWTNNLFNARSFKDAPLRYIGDIASRILKLEVKE